MEKNCDHLYCSGNGSIIIIYALPLLSYLLWTAARNCRWVNVVNWAAHWMCASSLFLLCNFSIGIFVPAHCCQALSSSVAHIRWPFFFGLQQKWNVLCNALSCPFLSFKERGLWILQSVKQILTQNMNVCTIHQSSVVFSVANRYTAVFTPKRYTPAYMYRSENNVKKKLI